MELTEWRDFPEPWTREPFDRADSIARLVDLVHELADLSKSPSYAGDNLFLDTEPVRRLSRDLKRMPPAASEEALDELESLLVELRKNRDVKRARKGSGPTYAKGVTRAQVLDARDRLMAALDDFMYGNGPSGSWNASWWPANRTPRAAPGRWRAYPPW